MIIVIPFSLSALLAFFCQEIYFGAVFNYVFFKFRKRFYFRAFLPMIFYFFIALVVFFGSFILRDFDSFWKVVLFDLVYVLSFLIMFYVFSYKKEFFSNEKMNDLYKQNESLNRSAEVGAVLSGEVKDRLKDRRKKIHKNIMKVVNKESLDSLYCSYEFLKEISFSVSGKYLKPFVSGCSSDDFVVKVNVLKRPNNDLVESKEIELKYFEEACLSISKPEDSSSMQEYLSLVSNKAFDLKSYQDIDVNHHLAKVSKDENIDEIKKLFASGGVNVNYVHDNGWTALLIAAANGQAKTVLYLLQKAADPNLANKHGATPLHFASKYGLIEICRNLVLYHANVNQRDAWGTTPIMLAAEYGHGAIVSFLIKSGADTDCMNDKGKTALDYAVSGNYGEICRNLKNNS